MAIGVTSDLAFAACVTFINFAKHHATSGVTFYLYSDRNLEMFVRPLKDLGLDVVARKYKATVPSKYLWRSKSVAYFSPLVLSKFEAFELLERHDEVLWLDYDIIIVSPFLEVLGNRTHDISFVPATFESNFLSAENLPPGLSGSVGMSAGFIHLNQPPTQPTAILSDLYRTYVEHYDNLYMPEQAVFGIVIGRRNLRVRFLDELTYCSDLSDVRGHGVRVVHCPGPKKFWNGVQSREWNENYDQWLKIGGTPFNPILHYYTKSFRKFLWLCYRVTDLVRIREKLQSWR